MPGQPLSPPEQRDSVRLTGVSKTYPNGKAALIDVDLVIPEGGFIFLVGPSGAGKSTLIKLLVRDEKASQGSVEVAGHDRVELRFRRNVVLEEMALKSAKRARRIRWLAGFELQSKSLDVAARCTLVTVWCRREQRR